MYMIWRDAGKDARKLPPNNNNDGCVMACVGFFVIIFAFAAIKSSFEVGSPIGIFIAIAAIVGFIKGCNK